MEAHCTLQICATACLNPIDQSFGYESPCPSSVIYIMLHLRWLETWNILNIFPNCLCMSLLSAKFCYLGRLLLPGIHELRSVTSFAWFQGSRFGSALGSHRFKQPIQGKINKSIFNIQYVSSSWLVNLEKNTFLGAHCPAFIFRSWARIHLLNWNSQSKTLDIIIVRWYKHVANILPIEPWTTWASGWTSRHEVLVSKETIDPPGVTLRHYPGKFLVQNWKIAISQPRLLDHSNRHCDLLVVHRKTAKGRVFLERQGRSSDLKNNTLKPYLNKKLTSVSGEPLGIVNLG